MKLNRIEMVVALIILVCLVASIGHSFLDYVSPLSVREQRAQMEPTLEMYQAYGLADERGRK